jgi:choline kinase
VSRTRRALLLAAGRGSRLAPYTDDRPKCLVPILGKPLLAYQIAALQAAGIDEIAIVGGYRAECLDAYGHRHFVNPRWQSANMVVSLLAAADWFAHESSLVCYTDIVYTPAAIEALAASPADIVITQDPNWLTLWGARFADPLDDAETFSISADGRLQEIGGKTSRIEDIQGQYMGLLKFSPQGWQQIHEHLAALPTETCDRLDMTGLIARLLTTGTPVHTVATPWPWAEVDHADDLHLYEHDPRFAGLRQALLALLPAHRS